MLSLSWLALGLATTVTGQNAGSIVEVGDTLISAMMVRFLSFWKASRETDLY
jgi:hypothetical protein